MPSHVSFEFFQGGCCCTPDIRRTPPPPAALSTQLALGWILLWTIVKPGVSQTFKFFVDSREEGPLIYRSSLGRSDVATNQTTELSKYMTLFR
jgi:hypothetical protein